MAVMVTHGGDPIPKSPFKVTVAPSLDLGKVKVQGLNESKDFNSTVKPFMPKYFSSIFLLFTTSAINFKRSNA